MGRAGLFGILLVLLFLGSVLQHFIPPVEILQGARVLLVPVLICYGAMALPLPYMLGLVLAGGLMWDLGTLPRAAAGSDIVFGTSVLVFAGLGAIAHGLRPLFLQGRWEVHCLMSGVITSLLVFVEYALITFHRAGWYWSDEILWRILGPGIFAMFLAPLVYLFFRALFFLTGQTLEDTLESGGFRI